MPKIWLGAENFVRRKFLSAENFVRRNILSAEILSKSLYIASFDFLMLSKLYLSDDEFEGRLSGMLFNESPCISQPNLGKQHSSDH